MLGRGRVGQAGVEVGRGQGCDFWSSPPSSTLHTCVTGLRCVTSPLRDSVSSSDRGCQKGTKLEGPGNEAQLWPTMGAPVFLPDAASL